MYICTSMEECHVDDVPRVGIDVYSMNKGFCPKRSIRSGGYPSLHLLYAIDRIGIALRQDVTVDCRDGTASDIRQYACYGVTDDSAKDATAPVTVGTGLASSEEF